MTQSIEKIKKKLLPYQINHVNNLVRIMKNNNCVADMSDTGTGKTYTAIAMCYILNLKPIIICPKSVMSSWKRVAKFFKLKYNFIVNYETAKLYKYYNNDGERVSCSYIKENEMFKNKKKNIKINDTISSYKWRHLDDNTVFIFDEVHRASNLSTFNGQLLFAAKLTGKPLLLLSATMADSPDKFKLFYWILNFIDPETTLKADLQYPKYLNTVMKWLMRDSQPMLKINNMLFPNRATRMRIDALGDLFPKTQITAEPYSMGNKREKEIERQYSIISAELDNLEDKMIKDKSNILVRIMRAHQKIEILKVPTMVELTNDYIVSGFSVVLFVNFNQTLKLLKTMLRTDITIHGEQTYQERDNAINTFNSNKSKIIICNIKAGGVGISLHDIHGGHPRATIISPPWSSIDLVQALGRVHRAGGKSKSIQRIVYTANTIEEKIADKLRTKLDNLNTLNDGGVKDMLTKIIRKKF